MSAILDFAREYWWAFAILFLIILVWLWSKLDFHTQHKLKETFSGKTLFMIIFIATWYFWDKYGETVTVSSANRYMPIIAFAILSAINYIGGLRYETQQIICSNGFHASYSRPPLAVNGFLIFACDSFSAGGIAWHYAKRILIVREETTELFSEGALSLASPTMVSIYELDPDVKSVIDTNENLKSRWGSKEIYFGWFDDINEVDWNDEQLEELQKDKESNNLFNMLKKELGVNNPSIKEMFRLYRNTNKSYNKQSEILDSTVESVEKGVEHHKRVKDAYVPKSEQQPQRSDGYEDV